MKRRQFLKSVFGVIVGLFAVPSVVYAKEWKFVVATYNGKGNSDGIEIYPVGTRKDGKKN